MVDLRTSRIVSLHWRRRRTVGRSNLFLHRICPHKVPRDGVSVLAVVKDRSKEKQRSLRPTLLDLTNRLLTAATFPDIGFGTESLLTTPSELALHCWTARLKATILYAEFEQWIIESVVSICIALHVGLFVIYILSIVATQTVHYPLGETDLQ